MLSCHDHHLCWNIYKSHHEWKVMGLTDKMYFTEAYAPRSSADCDLDLWPRDMGLVTTQLVVTKLICAKLISNPTMHDKVVGRTRTGFTQVYAQSLSAYCDLDLWPSNMVIVHNTFSCPDHLCLIIYKSHHTWQRYGFSLKSVPKV